MVTDLFELVTSKTVASWSPQRFFRHGHRENCFELVTENKFSSWSLRETFCELVTAEKRRIGRRNKVFEWVAAKVFELVAAKMFSKLATENKSNWSPRQNVRAGHRKKYVRVGRREEIELVTATSDRRGHREKK